MNEHREPGDSAEAGGPETSVATGLVAPDDQTKRDVTQLRMSRIAQLAHQIGHRNFPSGDRAALRRLEPEAPDAPAFWHLLLEVVPEEERRGEEREGRWAVIMNGLALMSAPGVSAHRRDSAEHRTRVGTVLAELKYSDRRLTRLLRAGWPELIPQVRRLSRLLATRGRAIDWARFGLLILAVGEESREHQRRAIARDYFGQLVRQQSTRNE